MELLQALQIVVGLAVLLVPGYMVSLLLFPKNRLDGFERAAATVALSMAILPLAMFYSNKLLGVAITPYSDIAIILLISFAALVLKRRMK